MPTWTFWTRLGMCKLSSLNGTKIDLKHHVYDHVHYRCSKNTWSLSPLWTHKLQLDLSARTVSLKLDTGHQHLYKTVELRGFYRQSERYQLNSLKESSNTIKFLLSTNMYSFSLMFCTSQSQKHALCMILLFVTVIQSLNQIGRECTRNANCSFASVTPLWLWNKTIKPGRNC